MPEQLVGVTTMTDDFDPASAVQAAAEGDHQAWERLVDHYAGPVRAVTGRFGLAEDDATDVYQTTFLRLLEHIDRLEQPPRVGSWLEAAARDECRRRLAG